MEFKKASNVELVTAQYPDHIQSRFDEFKSMVHSVAEGIDDIKWIEESIKWNEPTFKSNIGSPFRFGWSSKASDQFGLYFICTTTLVETYKKLYPDFFNFDGNRGLIFQSNDPFPKEPLLHCIELALRYKKVRDYPLLGA